MSPKAEGRCHLTFDRRVFQSFCSLSTFIRSPPLFASTTPSDRILYHQLTNSFKPSCQARTTGVYLTPSPLGTPFEYGPPAHTTFGLPSLIELAGKICRSSRQNTNGPIIRYIPSSLPSPNRGSWSTRFLDGATRSIYCYFLFGTRR